MTRLRSTARRAKWLSSRVFPSTPSVSRCTRRAPRTPWIEEALWILVGAAAPAALALAGTRFDHAVASADMALILVIRPLAGAVSLTAWSRDEERPGGLSRRERWATSFFGVRGVGSIYYLAFAAGESSVLAEDWLWSTVAFTVVASVLVHGVLSRPVMRAVEEDNARRD